MRSPWLCLYLRLIMTLVNLPNHALGDCFNPYCAFLSLQTGLALIYPIYPGGNSIFISSRLPCRYAFFYIKLLQVPIMICYQRQNYSNHVHFCNRCKGLQVIHSISLSEPFGHQATLYLPIVPSTLYFTM